MRLVISIIMVLVVLTAAGAHAASWIVWPGQSLQAAITNAAAGDNITLKEGNYVENITLTKGLDIRGEEGKENTTSVQGTFTISNAGSPVYLKGFKIGVSTSGTVTINNSSDVRMDYITVSPGSLGVGNSKLYLYRSSISGNAGFNTVNVTVQRCSIGGDFEITNGETKLLASTVTSNVTHTSYTYNCTIFQSTVGERLWVNATNYWIGYNTMRHAVVQNGGGEIVGNRILGRNANTNGLYLANTSPYVRNNVIRDFYFFDRVNVGSTPVVANTCNGVLIQSGSPNVINNVIASLRVDVDNAYANVNCQYAVGNSGNGILVVGGNPRIISCIVTSATVSADGAVVASGNAVYAGPSVELKYCDSWGSSGTYNGGCTTISCRVVNPVFTGDYVLSGGSQCIDAGAPEPEFNDLNGTRNDMGIWGGHAYDPVGRTTTSPVVMATSASPLYVKRGQNVMLKARGAVAAP